MLAIIIMMAQGRVHDGGCHDHDGPDEVFMMVVIMIMTARRTCS